MIRIVHSDLPLGLRLMVTRDDGAVVITVSSRLAACAQRAAVRAGIAAARRAGWLRARVPAVVLIGPAAWLADRLGRVHAAVAAGAATAAAAAAVGVVAVTAGQPAVHLNDQRPAAVAPRAHRGARRRSAGAVPAPVVRVPGSSASPASPARAVPSPQTAGSATPMPTLVPSPAVSVSAGVSPSPSPSGASPPGICLKLPVIGICVQA